MSKKAAASGSSVKEEGKLVAILAYLLVGIIWYFADEKMKKNTFAKFHTKQGIILIISWIIVSVIWNILPWGLYWVASILEVVLAIFAILGIINAINGQEKEMPIIGQFAKSLTF